MLWPFGESLKRRRIVRTAEVVIEVEEKALFNSERDRRSRLMWCPACRQKVEIVTLERAAGIAGVSMRTIYRWVEVETILFIEDGGHLLICIPGLFRRKTAQDPIIQQIAGRSPTGSWNWMRRFPLILNRIRVTKKGV